jgi:hypothetical protein
MIAAMTYLKRLVTNGENIGTTLKFSPLVASFILSHNETNIKNDNRGFLQKHLLEIQNLPEIQSLVDYMQNSDTFKKYYKKKFESGVLIEKHETGERRELSAESRRDDIMRRFIYTLFICYASLSESFPKFGERGFRYVYSRMESHLYGELEYTHFIPLHSFTMATKKMILADKVMIREIVAEEKAHLVDLGLHFSELTPLKYVAEFHGNNSQQADRTFQNLINALKLFKKGAVSYGIMSSQTDQNWCPMYTYARFLPNAKIHMLRLPFYELNEDEMRRFRKFYKMFERINEKISRLLFMQIAIKRFGSAVGEFEIEDRILDLMIALEALYSDSAGDITYRLAVRIPTLLNVNRHYAFFLSRFVKEIYGVRSSLVHGSKIERNLKTTEFSISESAEILESITRSSIRKFLNLLKDFNRKEDIIALLDKAVITRSDYHRLTKETNTMTAAPNDLVQILETLDLDD